MLQPSLLTVGITALSLEGLLYGIFLVLFLITLYVFLRKARRSPQGWKAFLKMPLLLAAIGLFLTVSAHWIISVNRAYEAFVWYKDGEAPLEYYGDKEQHMRTASIALAYVTVLIGSAILIYRLWVIWNYRRETICLPLLGLCATIACCVGAIEQSDDYPPGSNASVATATDYTRGAVVLIVCTNLYAALLIAWRFWRNRFSMSRGSRSFTVLLILIQTASIHVGWTLFHLILFFAHSATLRFTIVDLASPITGIAFMLINVAVVTGWEDGIPQHSSTPRPPAPPQGTALSIDSPQDKTVTDTFAMSNLETGNARTAENY